MNHIDFERLETARQVERFDSSTLLQEKGESTEVEKENFFTFFFISSRLGVKRPDILNYKIQLALIK